jgi:hypothetical protein
VQDDHFLSTVHEVGKKLRNRLDETAKKETLTPFRSTISERAKINTLYEPMIELMRAGQSIRANDYSSDDLRAWEDAGTLEQHIEQHRTLSELGIVEAIAAPKDRAVTISTYGESSGGWAPTTRLEHVRVWIGTHAERSLRGAKGVVES